MHKIEIVGMRKNRDLKIVLTIIILAVIAIIVCLGIILFEKKENQESITTSTKSESDSISKNENTNQTDLNNDEKTTVLDVFDEKEFIKKIDNIYNGKEGKKVFLTFDDGPSKEVTPRILDILSKYNVKATFFVLGNRVNMNPDIIKREYNEGHYIANHGYSHKYSSIYKDVESVLNEYYKTEETIRKALGKPDYSSHLFRFPGGSHGGPYEDVKDETRKKLKEEGIAYLDWSALTYDAAGVNDEKEILENVKSTIKGWNNVVILMHDAGDKKITYESLDNVIEYLQEEGYNFKNIYDIIR